MAVKRGRQVYWLVALMALLGLIRIYNEYHADGRPLP